MPPRSRKTGAVITLEYAVRHPLTRAVNRSMQECLPTFDVLPRLGEIHAPPLVLTGMDDWEESGHFPFIEEQARCTYVVTRWLEALG